MHNFLRIDEKSKKLSFICATSIQHGAKQTYTARSTGKKCHRTKAAMRASVQVVRQGGLAAALATLLLLPFRGLAQAPSTKDNVVIAVSGESWLTHLGRPFNETSMGKTGRLGPREPVPIEDGSRWNTGLSPISPQQSVVLHGSDLYRVNCQGCHGESGLGAPPEINSVINPVRSTSAQLVIQRMKQVGMEISSSSAVEMAQQSRNALVQRLHNGGQNMPPFDHLEEPEIRALIGYLNQLAGVPGAEGQRAGVTESRVRVGEHIVMSTCHTCHDATGSNPTPQQLMEGVIPPLSTLTTRTTLSQFVRKVTIGAPITMGTPPEPLRGRMSVFSYLSEDEAADAYLYLALYPPGTMSAAPAGTIQPAPPAGPTLGSNTSVRLADDPTNPQTVSLARLAVFPVVIFLFLGSVALKGMPRIAAHALRRRASSQVASARISTRQSQESGESRGPLGEVLPKAEGI